MLEQLKSIAFEKLKDAMASNALGENETSAAAQQGSSELIGSLTENFAGGNLEKITSLFSNDGNATEDNGVFQGLVGKLTGVLQENGMSAEAAQNEAGNIAPGLIEGLKEKFLSNDEADSGFNLSNIADVLGGDASGLLSKAKGLFS